MPEQDNELTTMQAATIRALASPHRLKIVEILLGGPREVNEIARFLDAGQATVSQHLAVMRGAGLVEASRDGRVVRYRLTDPEIGHACEVMRRTIVRRLPAPTSPIEPDHTQVTHA